MTREHSPSPETLADWAASSSDLLALTTADGALLWSNAAFRERFGEALPGPLILTPPSRPASGSASPWPAAWRAAWAATWCSRSARASGRSSSCACR